MKRLVLALIFLVFLGSHPSLAVPQSPDKAKDDSSIDALALELMMKSGLNKQIDNTPKTLQAAVSNNFRNTSQVVKNLSPKVVEQINRIISETFDPEIIKQIIVEHIEGELSPDDIRAVLTWLNSPLGREITILEEISTTPEAYKEMLSVVSSMKLASDYDQRLKLMHEIDQSMNATEMMLDTMMNMQMVSVSAMAAAFPLEKRPTAEMVKARFNNNRLAISQAISREIILGALYTYRDVSQEDIETYIDFMKTDFGKRYHEAVHEGVNKAYSHCGKLFGEAVARQVSGKRKFEKTFVQQYPQEK